MNTEDAQKFGDLIAAVAAAQNAAEGGSTDEEIQLLQEALNLALALIPEWEEER